MSILGPANQLERTPPEGAQSLDLVGVLPADASLHRLGHRLGPTKRSIFDERTPSLEESRPHVPPQVAAQREALLQAAQGGQAEDPRSLAQASRIALHRQAFSMALELAERWVRAHPQAAKAHNALGLCRFKLGRPAQALESFERAETLDRRNPAYPYNQAVAAAQLDRRRQAFEATKRYLEDASEQDPGYASAVESWRELESVFEPEKHRSRPSAGQRDNPF
jgi:tetratricopeptide (TPR) repeat protein